MKINDFFLFKWFCDTKFILLVDLIDNFKHFEAKFQESLNKMLKL